ncbi:Putative uncharacterized protein [Pararhodospirillum photometricum DSM 122]|uniref:OmpA-like domain-containing protein n=1 Tax=Pararhodospirillum photometricum DSM 122 TaxID=1150469 RepID=H6SRM4_PARPM|nr:Putative uncharacterized protein [Pararhodospirillum photometricum DSM 122]
MAAAAPAPAGVVSLGFAGAATDLPANAAQVLDAVAQAALADPNRRVTVLAYAHAEGSGSANRAKRLSLTRALTVRAYLLDKGVRSPSIEVRALGDPGSGARDRVDLSVSP